MVFKTCYFLLKLTKSKSMKFSYFIGCDVSKNELDFAVMQNKQLLYHKEIINKPEAIRAFIKELYQLPDFDLGKTVFCMEHTGIYNNHILVCLHKRKANICLEAATQIRNSMGNIRGKNDKVDAIRIAEYAYKNKEELRLWQPKREVIQELADISAIRSRLIEVQKAIKTPLKEKAGFVRKGFSENNNKLCKRTLASVKADLKMVDDAINKIIANDEELKRLFGLMTSVTGIGSVTATQIIIATNEFKDIRSPKQFACYAGVAPFTKESGMFKGKARVSHMANKKVKKLLHLSAMVAMTYNKDLKAYYERKVNEEKKNKMSTINAIRNKLILRIFACVTQNKKYEEIYTRLVA
jgi:transposase